MAQDIEFILQRTLATRAVQISLSPGWVWEEKTIVQWDTTLAALQTQRETEQDAEAEMIAKRGETGVAIDTLHSLAGRCLRMARNHYRNDPAKLQVFQNLRADAGSRVGKLQDALEWESGWEKTDAAWAPLPGQTLAAYQTSRLAASALLEVFVGKKAGWENADARLGVLGRGLNADCVAWYEAATIVFPAGTQEGDLIRSAVPTTYTPPSHPPTVLLLASATPHAPGGIAVTYVPGGGQDGSSLRLLWQVVGVDAGFAHDVAVNLAGQTLTGFASGQTVKVKTRAGNPAGHTDSPEQSLIIP